MINKIDISNKIAERLDISKVDARVIMDKFIDYWINTLAKQERIEIRGFGVFKVINKKSSIKRNPKTGEKLVTPPKNIVIFKPGKEFIEVVNSE